MLSLLVNSACAQKKTNKAPLQQKEELLNRLKELSSKVKTDSLFNYLHQYNNLADTALNIYQKTNKNVAVVEMVVLERDTIYVSNMASFAVVDLKPYKDKEKDLQFRRLKWHVKKVYPHAVNASNKLITYNEELKKVKSKRKRRMLMKVREKALKVEFEEVIKKMSKTSGRVLVKLIDRETGTSTYDIIKEMRGGFKAWIYQGVGKLYGADLKIRYNPKENQEDEMIERVVQSLIAVEKNGQ
jgi:hypothetical protein